MIILASSMPRHLPAGWAFPPLLALGLALVLGLSVVGIPVVVQAKDDRRVEGSSAPENARTSGVSENGACPESFPFALVLPKEWEERRIRIQKARCLGLQGQVEPSRLEWEALLRDRPGLADFWNWHLIRLYDRAGMYEKAAARFKPFFAAHPGEEIQARLRDLVMTRAVHDKEIAPEIRVLYLDGYLRPTSTDFRDQALRQARFELALSRKEKAILHGLAIQMWAFPKDKADAKQRIRYPQDPSSSVRSIPQGKEVLSRARRLYKLRLYKQVVSELEQWPLANAKPSTAKSLGRLYFRALIRNRALARAAVQVHTPSVMRRFSFDTRQQLIWTIRIQLRRKKIGSVLKFLAQLESRDPGDSELAAIYLELLRYNRGRGDDVTMNHWFSKVLAVAPGSQKASDAQWFMVWDVIRRKDYTVAAERIEKAWPQANAYHPVDQARLKYWKGRLLTLSGNPSEAMKVWEDLVARWPYGYYAALVDLERSGQPPVLRDWPKAKSEPMVSPPPPLEHLWASQPFPEAIFLFALGEGRLAAERLENAMGHKFSDEVIEEASQLFQFLKQHHLLLRLMANYRLSRLRTLQVADTPLWRRAYPRSHWSVVQSVAWEHKVDPYYIMAIMREESRFSTRADSVAGAKGLMQLMPATAREVAKRSGLPYEEDMLHLPELNIPLGALYLKGVLKRFRGNIILASAAYNAGPTTVRRWVRTFGKVAFDEFVERIPYQETQRYVKRVFLAYHVYRAIYEPPANPSLTHADMPPAIIH